MWRELRTLASAMAAPIILGVLLVAVLLLALPWVAELFDWYELWIANLLHTSK